MLAVRIIGGLPAVVEVPAPTGDGVRVRVASAGICGSDLHLIDSGYAPAVTIGHEIAGITADGRPVAIEPLLPCGRCACCANGDYHLCELAGLSMLGIGTDGGMAAELLVPERCVVRLDPSVDLADASLVEPIAVAVHGLHLAGWTPSSRTAVSGAGSIGCCTLAAITAQGGLADVACRHDHQRLTVERLGGMGAVSDGYDLVVETAGTSSALQAAVRVVRPGGTILLLSIHWEPTPGPGVGLWMKEVRLIHSMTYHRSGNERDVDVAARLLHESPEIGPAIITHRFPLDAATEAFACARDRAAGSIKVVLEP